MPRSFRHHVPVATARSREHVMHWIETMPHHSADGSDPEFFVLKGHHGTLRIPEAVRRQCYLKPSADQYDTRMFRWDHTADALCAHTLTLPGWELDYISTLARYGWQTLMLVSVAERFEFKLVLDELRERGENLQDDVGHARHAWMICPRLHCGQHRDLGEFRFGYEREKMAEQFYRTVLPDIVGEPIYCDFRRRNPEEE